MVFTDRTATRTTGFIAPDPTAEGDLRALNPVTSWLHQVERSRRAAGIRAIIVAALDRRRSLSV